MNGPQPAARPERARPRMGGTVAARLALAALLLTACGSRAPIYEVPPAGPPTYAAPDAAPAAPAFLGVARRGVGNELAERVHEVDGVAVATPLRIWWTKVRVETGTARLRVAIVDAAELRSVAAPAARDADFVWSALLEGQAIVGHEAARKLRIAGPASLWLGAAPPTPIGGFADILLPHVADVVIDQSVAAAPPLLKPRLLAIGAESGASLPTLRRDLEEELPGLRLTRMAAPDSAGRPRTPQPSFGLLGPMRYEILDNGFIRPDPAWVATNIASGSVPILGTVRCHRLMLPQLSAALDEIQSRGLAGEIQSYDGCFVPRFIARDPSRPLSMHAFGLAIDLNASTNAFGTAGLMHPDVVAAFERWGFEWGGRWSEPDPMHFELARLVQP